MANLKTLKTRIKSVKSTQKITKAMKVVAASKLKRARDAAEASRPYATKMEAMMIRLAAGVTPDTAPKLLVGTGSDKKHLLIICTADRGLCGGFNSSIIRAARRNIAELQGQGKKVALYCIGKKAYDLLPTDLRALAIGRKSDIARRTVPYATAEAIAQEILGAFEAGTFDVATVLYNHFKSAISQVVTFQQIVPLQSSEFRVQSSEGAAPNSELRTPNSTSYEFEPSEEELLADLLARNVSMQMYKSLLESAASEQGARMNAMENATKNAGEMIKKLSLQYNRTRQANITKELIEIISGAEAV